MSLYSELEKELEEIEGMSVLFSSSHAGSSFYRKAPERIRTLLDKWAEAEARAMIGEHMLSAPKCRTSCFCKSNAQWLQAAREKLRRE